MQLFIDRKIYEARYIDYLLIFNISLVKYIPFV